MHEISISGDFLGWISYLCQMSSVLVISMTRFFIDYCCSRSIVADVFIRIFIDFSYFSACVGCSLWILIHIFTPVNVVVSLDWPELPHRKGCESINGWIAIPMVRCGICAVSTLRMCFYARRISLISGLLNEDLICWVGS